MATEVWFRNPIRYAALMNDLGAYNVAWHRGILIKRRISPVKWARASFSAATPWRMLSIGDQGAVEWDPSSETDAHTVACYPVWRYGDPWVNLEALAEENIADDPEARRDADVEPVYRPRKGQEHRIVISNWPSTGTKGGRALLAAIAELQQAYPHVIFHLFEARRYRTAFGYGFRAVDLDPFTDARFKHVFLPNGRKICRLEFGPHLQWVHLLGFSAGDLQELEGRVRFNILAAQWAAQNYHRAANYRTTPSFLTWEEAVGLEPPDPPEVRNRRKTLLKAPVAGDKIVCEACSLANTCKHYRDGSVCTLSESETYSLTRFFKTPDVNRIIDGLTEILQRQADRAEMGMRNERLLGELDPETTKVLKELADGGVKLAKLINPALAGGPRLAVQINNGMGANTIAAHRPAAVMGAIVRELEAKGVPREDITPEMVMAFTAETEGEPTGDIIEAEVVE